MVSLTRAAAAAHVAERKREREREEREGGGWSVGARRLENAVPPPGDTATTVT